MPTHDAARRGFKVQITGGGHGMAFHAVRQELGRTGQPPSLSQRTDALAGITDLLSLPGIQAM